MILNMFQIAEIKARRNAALVHVEELCKTGKWQMSIPVRKDFDSDVLITNALRDSEALQSCYCELTEALAVATKRADDAERERDAARAVLREVEGKGSSRVDECCPCCDYVGMHAPDYALAACLKGGA